ncbi:MAG: DUF4252 domain-containing protein [Chlorobi bacterium]|nr:DUF4252 domain-containing protein [Chlorobiota bacterium]
MKRLTLILVGLAMSVTMMAQQSLINKYFDRYADNENFTKVTINQKMFSLFANFEGNTEEETEFMQAISKLEGLKVLVADSVENPGKLFKSAAAEIEKAGYEELMSVTDADENVKFSIREKDGIVKEMIMLVGGKEEFVLLSLYGEIDLKNVSKIANGMKLNGMQSLKDFHYENHDGKGHDNDDED